MNIYETILEIHSNRNLYLMNNFHLTWCLKSNRLTTDTFVSTHAINTLPPIPRKNNTMENETFVNKEVKRIFDINSLDTFDFNSLATQISQSYSLSL